jgi:hypothetical protein
LETSCTIHNTSTKQKVKKDITLAAVPLHYEPTKKIHKIELSHSTKPMLHQNRSGQQFLCAKEDEEACG